MTHTIEQTIVPGTRIPAFTVIRHTGDTATPRVLVHTAHTALDAWAWCQNNGLRVHGDVTPAQYAIVNGVRTGYLLCACGHVIKAGNGGYALSAYDRHVEDMVGNA